MSETKSKTTPRGRPRRVSKRDLKAELLETSRELLAVGGPGALSMREVARRAGCTHQAPYHYFEDRETILASLVCEGFDELAQSLRRANDLATTRDVRSTLIASAKAYIGFALKQPGIFRVMFRHDICNPQRFPDAVKAGLRARAELDRLNRIVHGKNAKLTSATILWSHVHGLSCLLVDGPLAGQFDTAQKRQAHLNAVAGELADLVIKKL